MGISYPTDYSDLELLNFKSFTGTKMKPKFKHYDLDLVEPDFKSPLTDLIIDLDFLRRNTLAGTTHPAVFFQLKHIFHLLESIGSARIEGNNTTLLEYIETKIETDKKNVSSNILEIQNIEDSLAFVDQNIASSPFNRAFVSEIHKCVTKNLSHTDGEGDKTPGYYRKQNIVINKSGHIPPDWTLVEGYMEELFKFINNEAPPKYDLLKIAIFHHRFAWIHPFGNGNGRTVRILTYAMLVKQGFNIHVGRIINPTAIFCSSRNNYYKHLSQADEGNKEGLLSWCEYVLKGLKEEIEKIDKLADYHYLKKEILAPALSEALNLKYINDFEYQILKIVVEKQVIQTRDIRLLFNGKDESMASKSIKKLTDKKMLRSESEGKRKYILSFDNSFLLRVIVKFLSEKDFLPILE